MINKANLMSVLESMQNSVITNTEHTLMCMAENQSTGSMDIFQPNAVVKMGDITRYYSLYNGEENANHPAYDKIPDGGLSDIFIRYFDVINDKMSYVSNWMPIEIPPDRQFADDHRFTITDHDGDSIDITDIEWRSDIPAINLTAIDAETKTANQTPQPNKPEAKQTSGGFRIWFCMLETGREAEISGGGDRVDQRVCIVTTPKTFPTKQFMDALGSLTNVKSVDHTTATRSTTITADLSGIDARIILFENGSPSTIYDSDDIIDITNDLRDKYKLPVVTTKTIIPIITKVIEKAIPEPAIEPAPTEPAKVKSRVNTTAKKPIAKPKTPKVN